ncbi:MAG: hypothetical protein WDA07_08255, partial [Leucobacter sp.]
MTATNAWGFAAVVDTQLAVLASVVIGQQRGRKTVREIRDNARIIRGEVKNDHPDDTNLRDDVDGIRYLVKDVSDRQIAHGHDIRGIRSDVGELRGQHRQDRRDLADLETRIQQFIRREHPGAD